MLTGVGSSSTDSAGSDCNGCEGGGGGSSMGVSTVSVRIGVGAGAMPS